MQKRTYLYFWLTGIVFLLYYIKYPNGHLNFYRESTLCFELPKQNYNELKLAFFIIIFSFFGIGIIYWLVEKLKIQLKKIFIKIHVYVTLWITWFNCILVFYSFYFPNKFMSLLNNFTFETIINIFCLLIIIAQVMFFMNVAFGIRKKKSLSTSCFKKFGF
jgi:hypothetical protein